LFDSVSKRRKRGGVSTPVMNNMKAGDRIVEGLETHMKAVLPPVAVVDIMSV
jgi:hypothetical protein